MIRIMILIMMLIMMGFEWCYSLDGLLISGYYLIGLLMMKCIHKPSLQFTNSKSFLSREVRGER